MELQNASELRNQLLQSIEEVKDPTILAKVQEYLKSLRSGKATDWWTELSPKQKKDIEIGATQLKEGKGIPHDQVRRNINTLLGRND